MRRQDGGERVDEAGLAGQRRALGTDDRQGNELRVVALEPRQEAGAQERRLARARGAEDRHQSRRRSRPQAAKPVDGLDDRRVAAEENAGVRRLLRFQAAVGRRDPVRPPAARQRILASSPAFSSPRFSRRRPDSGIADVPLLIRAGHLGRKQPQVLAVNEIDDLPDAGQFVREEIRSSSSDRSAPRTAFC